LLLQPDLLNQSHCDFRKVEVKKKAEDEEEDEDEEDEDEEDDDEDEGEEGTAKVDSVSSLLHVHLC